MNRIWNSVVGKLWVTILLLVSFVLFIITILMLEFLGNYHIEQAEASLRKEANTIARIVNEHDQVESAMYIISDILGPETNALIAKEPREVSLTLHEGQNEEKIKERIMNDRSLVKVFESSQPIIKEMILPSLENDNQMESFIVLASPLNIENDLHGAVFIYQSLDVIHKTTKETTNIVFLSAFIAFMLTTFFAFFLSTRITSPLRKMREAAFELSKGNFDTKLPALQNDEIGQLATAFNQMGRQLKHHLEVINQEKEQLSSILTSMTDAVITFNRDHTILLSNPQAEKLLQKWFFRIGTSKGQPIPIEMDHMLDHVLHLEEEINEELEMEGSYYAITFSPLYSGDSIRGAVAVLRDMTEQNRLDRLRSDFIANVSHELRTPIAMLQGYSEAIIDDVVSTDEERDEMIKIIYEESKRMGRLVTDLLDLARMESGRMRLYRESVTIAQVIERITQKFAQVARESNVELKFSTTVTPELTVDIDEDRIEQVLTNLIDNAIRHTSNEGNVSVRVEQHNAFVKISVEDTGSGIPTEDLPFVFERFYKADKSRTRGKGGTGLGLAIAKNMVEAHDGTITVKSEETVGTIFTFTLPIKNL
ncbi:ATP-binding protein [Paenisporosarcina sp. OV554]|uniref:ATP-binding protein n=1 Tax=Paenisporosarcina sp. OV554 TaxID=2135694 RepID=UPI000D3DABA6|nr:ATP-binding protein [Paenisporosarcina sp. OV554]PUB09698.1 two-component system sensor histidine kinase ResE [Paenisporosarcina sp. OV554]